MKESRARKDTEAGLHCRRKIFQEVQIHLNKKLIQQKKKEKEIKKDTPFGFFLVMNEKLVWEGKSPPPPP